jgi:hypothetical protein
MKDPFGTVPMLYERSDAYVVEAFRRGEFDYLEGAGEVSEADFFSGLNGEKHLAQACRYISFCL